MSVPMGLLPRDRVPWRKRPLGLCAVLCGHLLARLSPYRLRQVLTLLSRGAQPAPYLAASQARKTIIGLSVTCAGEGCLPRSIATALLCRAHGCWPTWRAGARINPFSAHAWVEADGKAVDELTDIKAFTPTITVPPSIRRRERHCRGFQ